jgi:NAD(P)-dependent dehydrogenase (short-subunit alcohol dehydrogenase family)
MKMVITGANRGIGLALVQKYLNEGHEVIALCRKASEELMSTNAKVMENVDVTKVEDLERAANEIADIDLLISNAGLLIGDRIESVNFDDIQAQVEVNTYAPLKVALTLGKKVAPGGKYGIMTSRMGSIADNTSGGQYGYRISKSAANAVGKSLAEDWREENIAVLLLHPGYVRTEMTNGNGLIDADESAAGLYEILSKKGMNETGTFWHTNGERLPY